MTETERNQIKDALFKCAEENENRYTFTGHIVVSSLCKSAVERIAELEKEISELKKICDFNCPVHKLATHNTCLTCPAVRNSPHHDLKNVTDEELQKIIKDAEAEMEM